MLDRRLLARTVHVFPLALDPARPRQPDLPRTYDPTFLLPLFLLALQTPDAMDLRSFVVRPGWLGCSFICRIPAH